MISLTHQTRIAINLIVEDDTGSVAQFLAALTAVLGLLVMVSRWVSSVIVWLADFIEAGSFTVKVLAIGFNSLAFGLGVKL
ncbi:MAG: hypothetical protein FOGNACKC_04208 [Anaerolineae bacterium]|nr:hypothetical protein [Anaerolineae bacterium]